MLADIFYQNTTTLTVRCPGDGFNIRTVRFYLLLTTFAQEPAQLLQNSDKAGTLTQDHRKN